MTLTLHILKWLRAGGDNLTPEEQLRSDLRMSVSPTPSGTEISEALNQMEDKGWAVSIRDPEIGTVRWQITDEGRAQLSKRKL